MYEGKLIRLRAYSKDDIANILEYINDFDVKKYLMPGIPLPFRYEDELKWYEKLNPMKADNYSFAIERKEDNKYIGGCGIVSVDWKNSVTTVGIFLGKPFWNKGYGTDAMKVLINFIFNEMNVNKVKLHVFSFNKRAIKSYEKVGFKIEGILREEIFREGKYHDEIIMGLLRNEWTSF
ncbi:acetyltransferase [Marinitoga sp. 1197]|uniref:GNAT family N-acetyltransferase n=1 Tax=unclassified Marinitoga TaxID=2640159 RepID=UPI0006417382|nr:MULTISPECIES: GNAT family protein [unclassified Marinitoga]KLO21664.1 acetyltransferase [Marinitoga sp. 1155]KLO22984.1 acetyltransferase [Marinitoga sp. 1197]NUU99858.1 acetyltransferase [Marinitoga sp. 1154]